MSAPTVWSAPAYGNGSHGALAAYQESLAVGLIATPRAQFRTCQADEPLQAVIRRNQGESFDHLPVVVDGANHGSSVVGILALTDQQEAHGQSCAVRDCMAPLSEEHLVGADASILAFIREADARPFRLVVSGGEIAGLVSISDLQRLPVRAALFAMVTHLEMEMAETIRITHPHPKDWIGLLTPERAGRIEAEIQASTDADSLVDPLLFTQFGDKVGVLAKSLDPTALGSLTKTSFRQDMHAIQDLRDRIAHANDYAATREDARQTCIRVRALDEWIQFLSSQASARTTPNQRRR